MRGRLENRSHCEYGEERKKRRRERAVVRD
jgi:hypothetical protein